MSINNQKDKYFYIWYCIWIYFFIYFAGRLVGIVYGGIVRSIFYYLIFITCIGILIFYKRKNELPFKELFDNVSPKIKKIWTKIKSPFIRLSLSSFALYSNVAIILGILAPMLYIMGQFYFLSWFLVANRLTLTDWTLYYYIIPPNEIYIWIIAEIIIFCFGLGIFLTGFITMVKEKIRGVTLVQTGIYKFIRHPQNLGIAIFFLPLALFIPGFGDLGIRMGDILSWSLFTFLISLLSLFEDWSLMEKFPDEFLKYYSQTGFYLPKFKRNYKELPSSINPYKNGVMLFICLGIFIILFRLVVQLFSGPLVLFR